MRKYFLLILAFFLSVGLLPAQGEMEVYEGTEGPERPVKFQIAHANGNVTGQFYYRDLRKEFTFAGQENGKGEANLQIFGDDGSIMAVLKGKFARNGDFSGEIQFPNDETRVWKLKPTQNPYDDWRQEMMQAYLDSLLPGLVNQDEKRPVAAGSTRIEWENDRHDFGEAATGEVLEYKYWFRNVGTEDFIISKVKPTCGCTSPDWTEAPVPPGKRGYVSVRFNTAHKTGHQQKAVTVFGNTEPAGKILTFTAFLKE